ncbi:hypothetical protein MUN89_21625 [Halobacillus salinarum]|uniref:Uncharacterized protein n=1 Tax=Halobacillus salinarum TaxID=2932257 RepID=A0ABY4EJP5_9BACI|nr:hypothetical protein [Halobacillus salinarum]UOQ44389.1 hypothetical protein MUN89_21625 [Halobacillus salinarum]
MNNKVFLYLACVFAGFALSILPETGTFLDDLDTFFSVVGYIAMAFFSLVLIYFGLLSFFNKNTSI